jgi:hypothetical protein
VDIAGVREAIQRQPFEPFLIRLADGRALEVRHPEFVAVGRRRIVVISDDGVESWSAIEPLLIVSLDSIPGKPKGGNGTQKKKRPGS